MSRVIKVLVVGVIFSMGGQLPVFSFSNNPSGQTPSANASSTVKNLVTKGASPLGTPSSNLVDSSGYFHVPDGHLDITFDDLKYILDQIKFGEAHSTRTGTSATTLKPNTPNGSIIYPYDLTSKSRCLLPVDLVAAADGALGLTGLSNAYTYNNLQPWGVRQVDGQCNNITNVQTQVIPTDVYAQNDGNNSTSTDHWGGADLPFTRMAPATNDPTHPVTTNYPGTTIPLSPAQIAYSNPNSSISDPTTRIISDLISDQSTSNPAAQAAANYSSQNLYGADPTFSNSINATTGVVTPVYDTPNVTPDFNVSAGYNSWFTLFGQFFDHGLDLVPKAGSAVFIPLQTNDLLYIQNPSNPNYMVLTRAADATGNSVNITTPYVDQSQTYGSHPSQNFFMREYSFDATTGTPHSTGFLLEGNDLKFSTLPAPWDTTSSVSGTLNHPTGQADVSNSGLPTWKVMKAQALLLGINLTDYDVNNVPVVATDQYGKFIPDPQTGFPMMLMHSDDGRYMWRSGTPANPVGTGVTTPAAGSALGVVFDDLPGVHWKSVSSGHPFLNDTMNAAVPFGHSGNPLLPDSDSVMNSSKTVASGYYDNENLDSHYIAGDARVNENIGLSAIHGAFHREHNIVAQDIYDFIDSTDPRITDAVFDEWNRPERIYQAARLVMEMEYQHMAYDEFVRRIAPNLPPFVTYNPNYNASISAEFASAVYRLGHSMLNETIARSNPGTMYDPQNNQDVSLITAFTNPAQARLVKPAVILSATWVGSTVTYTLKAGEVPPAAGSVVSIENMADHSFDLLNAVVDSVTSNSFTVSTSYTGGASITATALPLADKNSLSRTATNLNTSTQYEIADVSISDPGTNGYNYTPMESAAAIAQGMSAQRANEVDEFVTDSVRNNLLGLPLDLATLNITRGRDTGLPTLNQFRSQFAAALPVYTSWNDFISHLRYVESGANFLAAYGTHPSLNAPVTIGHIQSASSVLDANNKLVLTFQFDTGTIHAGDIININGYAPGSLFDFSATSHKYAVVSSVNDVDHSFTVTSYVTHAPTEIVAFATTGQLRAGLAPVQVTGAEVSDAITAGDFSRDMTIAERRNAASALLNSKDQEAIDFLNHTGTWAGLETGIDYIDLWSGGLAENPAKQPNLPGLLGPTFQYVFQEQTLKLQDGDRFYYLGRIVGIDLGDSIPAQKFTDIVRRTTPSRSATNQPGRGIVGLHSPGFGISDCAFSDNQSLLNENTACPSSSMSTTALGLTHSGLDNVTGFIDPANTAGGRLVGGDGDDSLIGGPGNDYLDGGASGGDLLSGGGGDDILIGGAGDDIIQGGPGNDVLDSGDAQVGDISDGGSGNDWLTCDNCNLIIPSFLGESGDDFIQAGKAIDTLIMGGEGNDWIEGMGGDDVQLSGDDNVQGGTNFSVQITGGNDVVIGGAGFDTTFGDGGDDIFPAGDAWDQIDGNEGFDWVTYEGTSRFDNGQTLIPSAFADFSLVQTPATATQTDVLLNTEGISGSSGNDLIITGLGQDIVEPGVTGQIGGRALYIQGTITTIVDGMAVSGAGIAPNTFVFGKPSTLVTGAVNGVGGITQTVVQLTSAITGDITNGTITFSMQPIEDVTFMTNLPALTAHTPGSSIHIQSTATLRIDIRAATRNRPVRTTYTVNGFNTSGDSRITVGGIVRLTPLISTTPVYTGNVASVTNGGASFTVDTWDVAPTVAGKYVVDYGFATNKWAGGYIATGGDGNDEIELLAGSNIVHGSYSLHVCLQVQNGAYTALADVDCGKDSNGNTLRGFSSMTPLNAPMVNGLIKVSDVKVVRELVSTNSVATSVSSTGATATYTVSKPFLPGDKIAIVSATPGMWDVNNTTVASATKTAPYTVTVPTPVTAVPDLYTDKQVVVTAVSHAAGSNYVTYTANNYFAATEHVTVTGFNTANAGFNFSDLAVVSATTTDFTVLLPTAPATSAVVTAASRTGTTVTYTADNNFVVNQRVSISGLSSSPGVASGFNLTNQTIRSVTATTFTITTNNNFCTGTRNCLPVTNANGAATFTLTSGSARASLLASTPDTHLLVPRGYILAVGMVVAVDPSSPTTNVVNGNPTVVSMPTGVVISSITNLGTAGYLVTLNKAININGAKVLFTLPVVNGVTLNAVTKNVDTVTEPYSSSYYTITAAAPADITANHAVNGYVITDIVNGGIDTVYDVEMIKFSCTDVLACASRTAVAITVQDARASLPPSLTPSDDAALRIATVGIAYRQSFILSGTPLPTSVLIATGALPPGLTMSALGVISGIPTNIGSYAFSVKTTTTSGTFTSPTYTIVVSDLGLPVISYPSYVPYVQQNAIFPGAVVSSTGGPVSAYTISPALPTGMTMDPGTGAISGRPSVITGQVTYTVTATNNAGSATAQFVFEVKPLGALAGAALATGFKHVGDVLTANTSSTSGTGPFTFTYQWQSGFATPGTSPAVWNWSDIAGATSETYTLGLSETDLYIRVAITATNIVGTTSATSNSVGPVYGPGVAPVAVVSINGSPYVGRTFTASATNSVGVDANTTYEYQWSRSNTYDGIYTPVVGATSSSYTSDNTFTGYLKVTVKVTSAAGSNTGFAIIGPLALLAPTAAVTVGGNAVCTVTTATACSYVGVALNASAATSLGSGVTFTYVWAATAANAAVTAAYTAIRAQTASTYTPVAGDLNKFIRCQATATNTLGVSTVYSQVFKIVQGVQSSIPNPTISGTAVIGNTLTVNPGTWDAGTVLTYQWLRNGVAITRATTTTYVLVAADAGTNISVRVTGTKVGFATYVATSATVAIPGLLFTTTTTPTITGAALLGTRLTAAVAAWAPTATFTYAWSRTCPNGGSSVVTAITGATTNAYTLAAADVGCSVFVRVIGTRAGYTPVTVNSASTATVTASYLPLTPAPSVAGTQNVGSLLTAAANNWGTGVTFTYAWYRGTGILGTRVGTAITYTPVAADLGQVLTVAVTGTRVGYYPATTTFNTNPIAAGSMVNRPIPTLGLVAPATTITTGAVVSIAYSGAFDNGVSLSYQWYQFNGTTATLIPGATASTYTIAAGDAGLSVKVQVTATKAGYTDYVVTSAAL